MAQRVVLASEQRRGHLPQAAVRRHALHGPRQLQGHRSGSSLGANQIIRILRSDKKSDTCFGRCRKTLLFNALNRVV